MLQHSLYRSYCKASPCAQCNPNSCWSCHQLLQSKDHVFCDNCHKIQPPPCTNYFSIFNQPKTFNIDENLLTQRYKKYQSLVHPDRFFNKSSEELDYADRFSHTVNQGYEILKNPISRAEYLLGLYGRQSYKDVPQDFLESVLDLHEQVEDTTDEKELKQLYDTVNQKLADEQKSLGENLSPLPGQDKLTNPSEASETLSKMKYYNRIRDLIKDKLHASSL